MNPLSARRSSVITIRGRLVILNQKLSQGIGKLIDATFNKRGQIEVEAEIYKPPAGDPTEGAYNLIRNGVLCALSIGGRWKKLPMPNGVTKLYVSEIVESSVATGIGANADALFEVVGQKSFGGDLDDELKRLASLSADTLDRDLAVAAGAWGLKAGRVPRADRSQRARAHGAPAEVAAVVR